MRPSLRVGLAGRLLAIVLVVVVTDFVLNTVLFDRSNTFALRDDDAARMAEHLVIAHRLIGRTPLEDRPAVARELSTERFALVWSPYPPLDGHRSELVALRRQFLALEPELKRANLHMQLMPLSDNGDIGGSIALPDRSVVSFRAHNRAAWTLNVGRLLGLALPSLLLVVLAWLLLRATLRPLRMLVRATSDVGSANPSPLAEEGQGEVRHLIRAFNAMQDRIHQLLQSNSQTMLAIGHDLRTPLARLELRIDSAPLDPELREGMAHDLHEMRDLLVSLQTYVESGDDKVPAERVDLAAMAQTQVDNACDQGRSAIYLGPPSLTIVARPVWIRRALSNLIENALRYAGNARVLVAQDGAAVELTVEDDGPGIPEDRMIEVLRPFIRLDTARTRDTAGMGLGLPIVERAARAEGGTLSLSNLPSGGLRATIRLPHAVA